jgi:hypothetical protein
MILGHVCNRTADVRHGDIDVSPVFTYTPLPRLSLGYLHDDIPTFLEAAVDMSVHRDS